MRVRAARRARPGRMVPAVALALAALLPLPAPAETGRAVVSGTGAGEMLKLRAGPGTGYRVIVGLPDGTALVVRGCRRVGGTPWCEVRLAGVRGLSGFVSEHYLARP